MAKISRTRRREIRDIVRKAVAEFILAQEVETILGSVEAPVFDEFTEEERDYIKRELKELCGRIDYKPTESEPESE